MDLWTVQVAQHRLAKEKGIVFLDTTVKSGDVVFAPSWDIVMDHKAGRISDEQYTTVYLEMMRNSYRCNRWRWQEVCEMDKVAIACYCSSGKFCHRHVLAPLLEKTCHRLNIVFTHRGELKGVPKR